MEKSLAQPRTTKEQFREQYGDGKAFLPKSSANQPLISDGSLKEFYVAMEKGCSTLIEKNPELVSCPKEEQK